MDLAPDVTAEDIEVFLQEADEQLQLLDEDVVRLEQEEDAGELLQEIFRAAHTLKGSSGMLPGFTASLAQRLDSLSELSVREASAGDSIAQASAFLAPGGRHLTVGSGGILRVGDDPPVNGVRPSVDVTMISAARAFGSAVIGVVLTGMGSDGTEGARAIKRQGGQVVVEHESSCTVYGMPKSVVDAGCADQVAALPRIAGAVLEMASARAATSTGGQA